MAANSIRFRRAYASQQYASSYRSARYGPITYDPSVALANDPDIYRKMMEDPIIAQAVDHRSRGVAQKEWQLVPASEDPRDVYLAALLEWMARKTSRLTRSLRKISEAFWLGSTWTHKGGENRVVKLPKQFGEMEYQPPIDTIRAWVPTQLTPVDRRMFRQVNERDENGRVSVKWSMAQTSIYGRADYIPEGPGGFDPSDFIVHRYDNDHHTLAYGGGLIESIYWYYVAKKVALTEGLQGLERWAQGWVIYKMDSTKPGRADTDSETFMQEAITEIETQTGRKILGIDNADDIGVEDGPGQGHQIVEFFLNYLDQGITRRISGALLPLGGGSDVGSNARSEVEERTGDLVIQGDQEDLAETMIEQFICHIAAVNSSAIGALGLAGAEMPTWEFTTSTVEDPVENTTVISGAAAMGLPMDEEDVRKKLGLKKPAPGQELVLSPQIADGMGGMGVHLAAPSPGAPAPTPEPSGQSVPDVADAAMNGAQVASMLEILKGVSAGLLAPGAAKIMLGAAFPSMPKPDIQSAVDDAAAFQPTVSDPAASGVPA